MQGSNATGGEELQYGEEAGLARPNRSHESTTKSWADEDEDLPPIGCCSCSCGQLSCISWSFLVLLLVIAGMVVRHNARDIVLLPGFFLAPAIVLYVFYWRKLRHQIPVDLVLKNFAFGFLPGACIVMVVELILSGIFFILCFHDQLGAWFDAVKLSVRADGSLNTHSWAQEEWTAAFVFPSTMRLLTLRTALSSAQRVTTATAHAPTLESLRKLPSAHVSATVPHAEDPLAVLGKMYGIKIQRTPGLYVFVFLLAYVVAAGTEETLKYMAPQRFQACRHSACPYVYLVCALACALGFSTVENIGYTFQGSGHSAAHNTSLPAPPSLGSSSGTGGGAQVAWQDSAQTADDEFAARIYTAYSRAVVALAAHGLFGGLVGIGLTKRHVLGQHLRYWHIVLPSVLAHGTFDFQQMLVALEVWNESTQNTCVVVLDALLLLSCAVFLWRQVRALPLRGSSSVSVALIDHGAGDNTGGVGDADHVRLLSA